MPDRLSSPRRSSATACPQASPNRAAPNRTNRAAPRSRTRHQGSSCATDAAPKRNHWRTCRRPGAWEIAVNPTTGTPPPAVAGNASAHRRPRRTRPARHRCNRRSGRPRPTPRRAPTVGLQPRSTARTHPADPAGPHQRPWTAARRPTGMSRARTGRRLRSRPAPEPPRRPDRRNPKPTGRRMIAKPLREPSLPLRMCEFIWIRL